MLFGSEQYMRDIPLRDPRSHWLNESGGKVFSAAEMAAFARHAAELNRLRDSDTVCAYLRRPE